MLGGFAWGLKAVYDWGILGRLTHTGYAPSHVTDYLYFIIPLFCFVGLVTLYGRFRNEYGKIEKTGLIVASMGSLLIATYYFWETYFFGAGLAAGLFLLMPGSLFMFSGLLIFAIAVIRLKNVPRWSKWVPGILAVLMVVWPIVSMFTYHLFGNQVSTRWEVLMQVFIGATWITLGFKLTVYKSKE